MLPVGRSPFLQPLAFAKSAPLNPGRLRRNPTNSDRITRQSGRWRGRSCCVSHSNPRAAAIALHGWWQDEREKMISMDHIDNIYVYVCIYVHPHTSTFRHADRKTCMTKQPCFLNRPYHNPTCPLRRVSRVNTDKTCA